MAKNFKNEFSKEERLKKSLHLLTENSDHIPLICEKEPSCKLEPLKKTKYLINKSFKINKFIETLTPKIKKNEIDALFFYINHKKVKTAVMGETTFGEIYDKYKHSDGFLYMTYTNKEIWG